MKLKKWTKENTLGFLIGFGSPIVFIPIVIGLLAWAQNYPFTQLWGKFSAMDLVRSKIISLSIISNLIWFYLLLNRSKYEIARGVIIGSICFLPYILYLNFIH
jgi:hypothetical protein